MNNNHPGRSNSAPRPTGDMLKTARDSVGHSQRAAAETVYRAQRGWQDMELGNRPVDPAILDLYLWRTGQIKAGESWQDWAGKAPD